ncbi:NAD-dependent deacetylase hst4 [Taphrina deformans PYCC 5710]|uniref:NAD-dependent deacetylase hst4 n=1 Tax=Taphrina deformans (strain PYCC 5710 / ATCC 11124 / CBS 356.35 / IMI 108563 / JCM 9778 / NBRC 8474) TaxID=1097556 RepID=R4XIZ9_TAPDE|nr:NAD-dependent deacetylase hst4 [Taphrina deformans PYCC 5710]|eukprot:CCG83350.1 NAD-dependent deacetylase hst4 [Taphrina deformans PYCC 5710]
MTVKINLNTGSCQKSLTYIADNVLDAKRIVFVSGAGISCSAGIPDFRSMNGLYSTAQGAQGNIKGKDLFDVSLFQSTETTELFYRYMANLRTKTLAATPTATHRLLKTLRERKKLLRAYTQNIDGLEARAGLCLAPRPLSQNDTIQLHGDIHTLKCFLCAETFDYSDAFLARLEAGEAPDCPTCADKCAMRVALGRRAMTIGTLRPDIVLYGEQHPAGEQIAQACAADLKKKPDCLLIAGTSLKVPGLKRLVKDFAKAVHDQGGLVILVDLTEPAGTEWMDVIDYHVQGRSDDFVALLKDTRPSFFMRQTTLTTLRQSKRPIQKTKNATKLEDSHSCITTLNQETKLVKIKLNSTRSRNKAALYEIVTPNAQVRGSHKQGFEAAVLTVLDNKENNCPGKRKHSNAFPDRGSVEPRITRSLRAKRTSIESIAA